MRVFKKNQGMVTRTTGTKEGDEQVCPSEMRSTRLFGWRDQKVDDQAVGLKWLVIANNGDLARLGANASVPRQAPPQPAHIGPSNVKV